MNFTHRRAILQSVNNVAKVTALAWSPNSQRLAAVTVTRIVYLFNEFGEIKDKFATKSADPKGSKMYIVTGMVFSPDSTKLAIGQSDNIIFIYKLGLEWGDKKSICNKFQQALLIIGIAWPILHQTGILFGSSDGKVKVGQLRTNKILTLYAHRACSPVVSFVCSPDNSSCLAGHLDGSIYRFTLEKEMAGASAARFTNLGSVPISLAWGKNIVVAVPNCKVFFYDICGAILQQFSFGHLKVAQDFSSACFNPSGDVVALGCFNGFHVFSLTNEWEDLGLKKIENLYTVSALTWSPDGSQLAVGSLCGNVDIYDACLWKQCYKGIFEFTCITKKQIIVRGLSSWKKILLQSCFGVEIVKINIYNEKYLIANTQETLLMGNLESYKLSEIPWHGSGMEVFLVEYPAVCMIYDKGELCIVEYGHNDVLGRFRTEHIHPSLISVCFNSLTSVQSVKGATKKVAYLKDSQTIQIFDLVSGMVIGTLHHDSHFVWLELDAWARHLLFCDERRELHLFDTCSQEHMTLLNICSFVQWVPSSDIIVAQSQGTLHVWYNVKIFEQAAIIPLKGDLEDVRRIEGQTELIVNEGIDTVSYVLDEHLVEAFSSLEKLEFSHAISVLEKLEMNSETEFIRSQLGDMALEHNEILYAERCYTALGHASKSQYLQKVNKLKKMVLQGSEYEGADYLVRAKLALLHHEWKVAKAILLQHDCISGIIQLCIECYRWKEAISVSENHHHPDSQLLHQRYSEWLLRTSQYEEAAKVKKEVGDVPGAVHLFLKGNLPGLAADCIQKNSSHPGALLDRIANMLLHFGMLEKLGDFMEKIGNFGKAMEAYQQAHAYHRAIELAFCEFPKDINTLQEQWGDWLVSNNQVDAAISHYVDAGCFQKAIEAAVASRQWNKAVQIMGFQSFEVSRPYYIKLALHFKDTKQYSEAEKYFRIAEQPSDAVHMYIQAKKWGAAFEIVAQHLSEEQGKEIYLREARELESFSMFKDAEKLYLAAQEHDLAINMYRKGRKFDDMIRLIANYNKIGWQSKAFIYLNQYLDISEAIDEEDSRVTMEGTIFERSDIPQSFPMPQKHAINKEQREEARDWVIQFSLNQQSDKVLLVRNCEKCAASIYEASLVCFFCKDESQACCVTGYPVNPGLQIECLCCLKVANKNDWDTYVPAFKSCPWCRTPQQYLY